MAFHLFSKKTAKKPPAFGFKLPKRTPAPDSIFLTKEKETKEWIETLPIANVGETSRQLFKTLINFNRMEMPFNQRIKTIECFREPLAFVQSNLEKHYYDMGMPLSSKAHKISVLSSPSDGRIVPTVKYLFFLACLAETSSEKILSCRSKLPFFIPGAI